MPANYAKRPQTRCNNGLFFTYYSFLADGAKTVPLQHCIVTGEKISGRIHVGSVRAGISPDLLPFVFDRFRQADNTTRRRFGGLGLGLFIVKHLAEMHGGTVEAQSDGEGLGSAFIVRLPIKAILVEDIDVEDPLRVAEGAAPADNSGPSHVRLEGLHLLVVDDEADARQMLVKVLEGVGARVTTAASAAEAIEALSNTVENNEHLDLLVSDVGMPDQDGYDLIRKVRQRGDNAKDLPAVALTAFARKVDAREAASAGFQMHLAKPVNIGDLTAAIARLAGRTD